MYDSSKDAKAHIEIIQKNVQKVIEELEKRKTEHDQSKLKSPEKETYDKYIPELKDAKYGSKEYYEIKNNMQKEGLLHHFKVNRHHPEHFANGINDMNLIDILEMVVDWYSASLKSDTSFEEGIKNNKNRFHMSDQLFEILLNTYKDILK